MPYLKIETNVEIKDDYLKALSGLISKLLDKPERYVMIGAENKKMIFDGKIEPCAMIELKSIGLPSDKTKKLSEELCGFFERNVGIKKERIYVNFVDFSGTMWGWNGTTF